jgi:hypothetical protein
MQPRLVIPAVLVLAAAAALAPPVAEAQRVVVRKGAATTTRTAQPPRPPTPARRPAPPRTTTVRVVQPRRFQSAPSRQLSLSVGALRYEPDGDANHPMAAMRVDWRLRNWLRSEMGVSYALAGLDVPPPEGGTATDEVSSSLLAATVGLQAELPFRYVRPYVGAAAGLFARIDEDDDEREGESFVRPTMAFPVGVRIPVSSRLGIRAEARFRFDEHRDGASVPNVEQTVGLSFGF